MNKTQIQRQKRIGQTRSMVNGMRATITDYYNARNCTIRFEDGAIVYNVAYSTFEKGEID